MDFSKYLTEDEMRDIAEQEHEHTELKNKKLIDLLVDNDIKWPEGALGVVQDSDGEVKFYTGEKPHIPNGVWLRDRDNDYEDFYLQTASDYNTAIITKTDWDNRKMKLFISGNRSIIEPSDKALGKLDEICVKHNISEDTVIILGDASGIDSFFQGIDWKNVIVYYSGKAPRNNVGNYPTNYVQAVGCGRAWHTCKDVAMSTHCDIHIGFVDTSKAGWQTSGTAANHDRVTNMGKPSYLIHI